MGAAGSVSDCIYISYDYGQKNNLYVRVLRDELRKMTLNVIDSLEYLIDLKLQKICSNLSFRFSFCVIYISFSHIVI